MVSVVDLPLVPIWLVLRHQNDISLSLFFYLSLSLSLSLARSFSRLLLNITLQIFLLCGHVRWNKAGLWLGVFNLLRHPLFLFWQLPTHTQPSKYNGAEYRKTVSKTKCLDPPASWRFECARTPTPTRICRCQNPPETPSRNVLQNFVGIIADELSKAHGLKWGTKV